MEGLGTLTESRNIRSYEGSLVGTGRSSIRKKIIRKPKGTDKKRERERERERQIERERVRER